MTVTSTVGITTVVDASVDEAGSESCSAGVTVQVLKRYPGVAAGAVIVNVRRWPAAPRLTPGIVLHKRKSPEVFGDRSP